MQELAPGTVFAGHRIESLAGRGGMGVVYRATHLALSRAVALKVIAPHLASDPDFRSRFEHESHVAASIDHRHVIPIYHAGEEDGQLFITMRYVEGTDLRELIHATGALGPQRSAAIVAQVAEALDAAHARGLVHRDVKPANVLIAYDQQRREDCYLTDFGLTKLVGQEGGPTKTGQWVGTIDYVAPEQIHGQPVDARADVYALACVLYHSLVGHIPFPRDSDIAKMFAHINDPPPPLPADLPPELNEVVARGMAKLPSERYPSAGDLGRAALAACAGRAPVVAERSVAVGDAAPPPTVIGGVSTPREGAPTHALPVSEPEWTPAPVKGGNSSMAVLVLVCVVVLALGAGVAVLAAAGVFSSSSSGDTPTTVTTTQGSGGTTGTTSTSTTTPAQAKVSASAINRTLSDYEHAYSDEDANAIDNLLTSDVVRTSDSGTMRGRAAVMKEYRRQFAATASPNYSFEDVQLAPGVDMADVSGRYRITTPGGAASTGTIKLHLVSRDDGLLIDRIDVVADKN